MSVSAYYSHLIVKEYMVNFCHNDKGHTHLKYRHIDAYIIILIIE